MTIERLEAILDAYGADPAGWPSAERRDALALLERSAEARARRDEAARLDSLLDAASTATPSRALTKHILAAAPGAGRRRTRRLVAPVAPLAAAALLVLWLTRTPPMPPTSAPTVPLASLGVYETPTDMLLSLPGLDVLDTIPALSCPDSALGCLDDDAHDRAPTARAERTLA